MENSPPHTKRAPPQTFELAKLGRKITLNFGEDLFFFFFWRSPIFGRKKTFEFRPKNHSEFWRRPFFFFLEITYFWAEKNVWISAEKSLWILAKTFFFFFLEITYFWAEKNVWISDFGRKITLNFGEDLFFFFFFGDHLILGGKNLWISDVSETFRLKFRTNRLKLIQGQWKFESTSYAHFSLFQNSPPLFQILATRLPVGGLFYILKKTTTPC